MLILIQTCPHNGFKLKNIKSPSVTFLFVFYTDLCAAASKERSTQLLFAAVVLLTPVLFSTHIILKVNVTQSTDGHAEPQMIKTLQRGDYFGEKALIRLACCYFLHIARLIPTLILIELFQVSKGLKYRLCELDSNIEFVKSFFSVLNFFFFFNSVKHD